MVALLLALVCMLGLFPATALAATPDTIKMDDCTYNDTHYDSPALGVCYMHQMHFGLNGKSTMGSPLHIWCVRRSVSHGG